MSMICGFLGGTIVAVESGYKVFPHPKPDKIYNRLGDAKWFLALRWCDSLPVPAGIINNTGTLSFFNQMVLQIGEEVFIPQKLRRDIFTQCLALQPNQAVAYNLTASDRPKGLVPRSKSFRAKHRIIEIQALEIDARYGKVALVKEKD